MFPFLRLGATLVGAKTRPPLDVLGDSVIDLRVWPGDVDQNRHLNNGRYLTVMDIGRFDLVVRSGLMRHLLRNRWYPVVTSATIRFRKPIDAFQRYQLRTRVLGWDERAIFIEQRFERDGEVHAVGVIRGLFLGPRGKVPTADIIAAMGSSIGSPPLPTWVQTWARSQEDLSEELRRAPAERPAPPL